MTLSIANLLTIAGLTIAAAGLSITIARGIMAFGAMGEQLKETGKAMDAFGEKLDAVALVCPKVEQHDKDIASLQKTLGNGIAKETRQNSKDIEVIRNVCKERHGHEIADAFRRAENHG